MVKTLLLTVEKENGKTEKCISIDYRPISIGETVMCVSQGARQTWTRGKVLDTTPGYMENMVDEYGAIDAAYTLESMRE